MIFLKTVYNYTDPWSVVILGLLFGLFLVLASSGVIHHKEGEHSALQITLIWLKRALVIISFVAFPFFIFTLYVVAVYQLGTDLANEYMSKWFAILIGSIGNLWWQALPLLLVPTFVKIFIDRTIIPKISQLKRKWAIMQTGDAASDVRIEITKLKPKKFNPIEYYIKDKYFYGLNNNNLPVYDSLDKYVKTHCKVLGPSQTGKGVTCGVEVDQAIWRGWGCIFMDRKPDDFIPDIMRESCIRNNREHDFIFLDLNDSNSIGYHPFLNGTDREVRVRVMKLFDLNNSGTNADHYKINARAAFDLVMPYWNRTLIHLKELLRFPPDVLSNSEKETIVTFGKKILTAVDEFLLLKQFNPKGNGLNIRECLTKRKVVLLRSSMNDTVVRGVEQCILMEMIQICTYTTLDDYVKVVIDEARFVMTEILADSLAVLLAKKLLMSLAYQSINDPKNLTDKTLNADSIKNGIETNTQTTISHRANDSDTAQWISDLTGTIQKTVTKMERLERNTSGAERWTGERSVGQLEENLINPNALKSLPPMVSVLIRPNELAIILYTSFIPVKEFLIKEGKYKAVAIDNTLNDNILLNKEKNLPIVEDNFINNSLIGDDPFNIDEANSDTNIFIEDTKITDEVKIENHPVLDEKKLKDIDMMAQELLDSFDLNIKSNKSNSKKDSKKSKAVKSTDTGNIQEEVISDTPKKPNDNVDLSSLDNIEGI